VRARLPNDAPRLHRSAIALAILLAGCPSPRAPTPPAGSLTLEIGRDGGSLRGVAGDGTTTFAAVAAASTSTIEARRGNAIAWQAPIAGSAGAIALGPTSLGITASGTGTVVDLALRGEPGAVVAALDPATGTARWKLAIDSSEWAVPTSIAATPDGGFVVGGSFSGTLRAASRVVSSAGKIDGFVVRLSATGEVQWLIRVGGAHADSVQGVAVAGDRIAITGTFATGAELGGEPLTAIDDKAPTIDVFVAELDARGHRTWSATFGGKLDDSVAGIAIDGRGRIAVAATVRDTLHVDVADISVRGPTDGLVVMYDKAGAPGPAIVLGGDELDELRAITASGDRIVVGGVYAGAIRVGPRSLEAETGGDAFVASLDGPTITGVWPIHGAGREEITALAPVPGGFIAGVAHTAAATVEGQPLASPKDPTSGFGLVIRALR